VKRSDASRSDALTFDRDLAIVGWVITGGAIDAGINTRSGNDVFPLTVLSHEDVLLVGP
jgi:hypothetical protein